MNQELSKEASNGESSARIVKDICFKIKEVIEEIEDICDEPEEIISEPTQQNLLEGVGLYFYVNEQERLMKEKYPAFNDNEILNIVVGRWEKLNSEEKNEYCSKFNPEKATKSKKFRKMNKMIEKALVNITSHRSEMPEVSHPKSQNLEKEINGSHDGKESIPQVDCEGIKDNADKEAQVSANPEIPEREAEKGQEKSHSNHDLLCLQKEQSILEKEKEKNVEEEKQCSIPPVSEEISKIEVPATRKNQSEEKIKGFYLNPEIEEKINEENKEVPKEGGVRENNLTGPISEKNEGESEIASEKTIHIAQNTIPIAETRITIAEKKVSED